MASPNSLERGATTYASQLAMEYLHLLLWIMSTKSFPPTPYHVSEKVHHYIE